MTNKPCTHCGGSGSEPDAVLVAARKHAAMVNGADIPGALKDNFGSAGAAIHAAALKEREQNEARITFLEAALRDILGRFPDEMEGAQAYAFGSTFWDYKDVRGWRVVLDGLEVNPASSYPGGVKP